jgi:hypothetical protein
MVKPLLPRKVFLEHLSGILAVTLVLGIAVIAAESGHEEAPEVRSFPLNLVDSLDLSSSLDRAAFRDMAAISFTGAPGAGDSLLSLLDGWKRERFLDPEKKVGGARKRVTGETLAALVVPYLVFLLLYGTLFVVTTIAARMLGMARFFREKLGRRSELRSALEIVFMKGRNRAGRFLYHFVAALLRGFMLLLLFTPAYVAAYAVRTKLDTQNVIFVVVLGVLSNGLLIAYASKFSTLLTNEARRGYVDAALVKGLRSGYNLGTASGLPFSVLWTPAHSSRDHVFSHIYQNASLQFLPSMKEHASFLVTSLAIVEMALNLNGHLCYLLLEHLLHKEYGLVLVIMFGIYLAVKAVEIWVDILLAARRGGNDER